MRVRNIRMSMLLEGAEKMSPTSSVMIAIGLILSSGKTAVR